MCFPLERRGSCRLLSMYILRSSTRSSLLALGQRDFIICAMLRDWFWRKRYSMSSLLIMCVLYTPKGHLSRRFSKSSHACKYPASKHLHSHDCDFVVCSSQYTTQIIATMIAHTMAKDRTDRLILMISFFSLVSMCVVSAMPS